MNNQFSTSRTSFQPAPTNTPQFFQPNTLQQPVFNSPSPNGLHLETLQKLYDYSQLTRNKICAIAYANKPVPIYTDHGTQSIAPVDFFSSNINCIAVNYAFDQMNLKDKYPELHDQLLEIEKINNLLNKPNYTK